MTSEKKALEYINELPPVDHQETVTEFADRCRECGKMRKGHWVKININGQHKIRCNKCDYIEPEYITFIRNYCPNCGAKMVEPQSKSEEV